MHKQFNKDDLEKYQRTIMYGRVCQYNHVVGYGFIHTEIEKDIFLSSFELGRELERKIVVGSVVKFVPMMLEGRIVAKEIEVVDLNPNGKVYMAPGNNSIKTNQIQKYGVFLTTDNDDEKYVYIITNKKEYRFYKRDYDIGKLIYKLNTDFIKL